MKFAESSFVALLTAGHFLWSEQSFKEAWVIMVENIVWIF